jgi:transcriptional regulator with XRE-family HTH domain
MKKKEVSILALEERRQRIAAGVTISALAREANTSRSWIALRESGFVTMKETDARTLSQAIGRIVSRRNENCGARNCEEVRS